MNWLAFALVGTVAAWFEYNYRRSRRKKPAREGEEADPAASPAEPPAAKKTEQMRAPAADSGNDQQRNASA